MDGYVLLFRCFLEHPLVTQLSEAWLKVWIVILLRANFKPSKWWDGTREIELPAGSFVTSNESLAKLCNLSLKQVRGALDYFERANMTARLRAPRYTVLTICNWETYQTQKGREGR